jgi:hypothetical protein
LLRCKVGEVLCGEGSGVELRRRGGSTGYMANLKGFEFGVEKAYVGTWT